MDYTEMAGHVPDPDGQRLADPGRLVGQFQ